MPCLVVGCGARCNRYLADAPAWFERIVGIVDSSRDALSAFSADHGFIGPSAQSMGELRLTQEPENIYIFSSSRSHPELVREARRRFQSATILVEKPPAWRTDLLHTTLAANNALTLNEHWSHPLASKARTLALSGDLGRLTRLAARHVVPEQIEVDAWRKGKGEVGGVLIDLGWAHIRRFIDLAGPVVRAEVESLEYYHENASAERAITVQLHHESGVVSSVDLKRDYTENSYWESTIIGERSRVVFGKLSMEYEENVILAPADSSSVTLNLTLERLTRLPPADCNQEWMLDQLTLAAIQEAVAYR